MSRFAYMIHDFETLCRRANFGLLLASCLAFGSHGMWGQFTDGLNVEFGKNRVQHRGFEWNYFEEGMFEVYHYREGDQLAGQVTRILSEEAKALAPMFGRSLAGPIQVLVFKSEAEFRQSNVGVMTSQDQETNIGGTAKLVGSKMFLYGRATGWRWSATCEKGWRASSSTKRCTRASGRSLEKRQPRSGPCMDVGRRCAVCRSGLDAESTARILDAAQTGRSNVWIKQPEAMRRCWAKRFGPMWRTSTACPQSPTSFT